ncbi:hypothetical protein N7457_003606 [Penicillium paradoxum]|uniref:uncharacterized protein n=1 Tax=Penicillium paradoxum TaxID=176176 RepID=UPI002546D63C|nr:uncharacterized protein N7457_003606 [Penicillium paradoxum]KAJ5788616.1 hypothetical protein N7457_003606 [Penicillium paradoxum]
MSGATISSAPDLSVRPVATLWAGPGQASNSTSSVEENVAYRFVLDRKVQTISSNGLPDTGLVSGILFVPSLEPHDPCYKITDSSVPSNVTRYEDVSDFGYPLVGLAPWVSAECSLSFLDAAQKVGTQAMIFFQPSSNDTEIPPDSNSSLWTIDKEEEWRVDNHYPVYAIPGPAGISLINDLSWYSDNTVGTKRDSSTEGFAMQSENQRLFARIENGTIIMLSLVLIIVYRLVLRKRRVEFQRRVNEGEVDLEALALNQMKAPQEVVDKMPCYTYLRIDAPKEALLPEENGSANPTELDSGENTRPSSPNKDDQSRGATGPRKPEAAVIKPDSKESCRSKYRLSHTQTTCAICIDDFVAGSSVLSLSTMQEERLATGFILYLGD